MKAGEDLKKEGKEKMWTTHNSEWYLDVGAKIERFNSGEIVILNTISQGLNYTKINDSQYAYFRDYGWDAGRYRLCVDEYRSRIINAEIKKESTENLEVVLEEFEIKLDKALQELEGMTIFVNQN